MLPDSPTSAEPKPAREVSAPEATRFRNLLEEQQERFAFATAAADIGYWFCDLPFDTLIWDERVKTHFWLPPDADVDINLFYERIHPDDRERTRTGIATSIANHTQYDIEYRTVSSAGQIKWIHAIGRTGYDPDGTPRRFDGVTLDVTVLHAANEALETERQRTLALVENVPVGLLFVDAAGRVLNGNRQLERIVGHPVLYSASANHYNEWRAFHPDGRRLQSHEYPLAQALADGGTHRGEFLYEHDDGSRRWIEITSAPILDANGRIVGGVVATADIDARKRAEQALVRTEKLAVVGRLASSISHEINNPLESVTNLLYLVEQNTKGEDTRRYCQLAQQELARVSHIVTHTLRFNRQTNAPSWEHVSGLLESAVAIYEPRIRSSGSVVERDYVGNDLVFCLGSELRQVFANLIGNAFDAAKGAGGKVTLRTREMSKNGARYVRVTVADTGTGMDDRTRQRIFEPFFTTKGDSGTGLGLWVTREILAKHGAQIRVRSSQTETRSGSVFAIWLPAEAGFRAVQVSPAEPVPAELRAKQA